jgi:fructose-1,6-bisphosphatase I
MSMIVEQAGGKAISTSLERILDLEIHELHQRTTIVMGSGDMVDEMKAFVEKYRAVPT